MSLALQAFQGRIGRACAAALVVLIGLTAAIQPALAHGPIFSEGWEDPPAGHSWVEVGWMQHVMDQMFSDGVRVDNQGQTSVSTSTDFEWSYGLSSAWTITASAGNDRDQDTDLDPDTGLLNTMTNDRIGTGLLVRNRYHRVFRPGGYQVEAIGLSTKTPTGETGLGWTFQDHTTVRQIFLGAGYVWNQGGVAGADGINLSANYGFQLTPQQYGKSDLMLLLESGCTTTASTGTDTGGTLFYAAPTLIWTLNNVQVKGGYQIPLAQSLNGTQQGLSSGLGFMVEVHL